MSIIEGHMTVSGGRYALACSRFNDLIVERLVHGATDALIRHGVAAHASPRSDALPDLFGDEWHQRMREAQQGFEHVY